VSSWGLHRIPVPGDDPGDPGSGTFGTGTRGDGGLDLKLPEPEPATGDPISGTGTGQDAETTVAGRIVRAGTGHAVRLTRTGTGRASTHLDRLAATPGTVLHAAANCRPMTIAEHAAHARHRGWVPDGQDPDGALGVAGEFTQRTAGRAMKIVGTAISRLADNPVAQWIAIAIALLITIAIWRLVL
jgi:hypothetical protein